MKKTGGCHCGEVRFEAEMDFEKVMACNCSICSKRGTLLDFIPETQFHLLNGESSLTTYLFNKKVIQHHFCKTCGILPFAKAKMPDGTPTVAINVRCLDDFDINSVKIEFFDGKHMQ